MSVTPTPDLVAVKSKQQLSWSSGDFALVATRLTVPPAEQLVESADLRTGWRVLDVATGSGNAALAAARCGTSVTAVDYVPALLERGRARAAVEGLDVEFIEGDAEDLPAPDCSFDAVLSIYGCMFAPDHRRTAAELVRVCRPGGTLALDSWTPDGFVGQMLRTVAAHVPPPPGVESPLRWGTGTHLAELFADALADAHSTERTYTFRFGSAEEFADFFGRWYGPTVTAFAVLDEPGRSRLQADLVDLARHWDRHQDGGPVAIPATYLETVGHIS